MYQSLNIVILIIFVIFWVARNKSTIQVKIKPREYLSKLSEEERKTVVPYFTGMLFIGLFIPAFIWLASVVGSQVISKIQKPQISRDVVYGYIGWCYTNKDCQHVVLNSPTETDEERMALVNQISPYMRAYTKRSQHIQKQN